MRSHPLLALALLSCACSHASGPSPHQRLLERQRVMLFAIAHEGYDAWARPGMPRCPATLGAITAPIGPRADRDLWGHPIVMFCGGIRPFGVVSVGPDGVLGTADDVHSWD